MTAPELRPPTRADLEDLNGHTIEELSDYLDCGFVPPDASIDTSSGCQIVLNALARLKTLSATLLENEARVEPARDDRWIERILGQIGIEARAGRDIPLTAPRALAKLSITEGAVRGIIRAAGDSVGTAIIGRCRLDGDVTIAAKPITVLVEVSVVWGAKISETVDLMRRAILAELRRHTNLNILAIDVVVRDIQAPHHAAEGLAISQEFE